MSKSPKLYTNRTSPRKKGKDFSASTPPQASASSAAVASYKMGPDSLAPPPPPQPPKESFARRYKFVWPLLWTVNLAVGAYVFTRTKGKGTSITEEEGAKDVPATPVSTTAPITEKSLPAPPITEAAKLHEPIHVDQWILEEKRKVKPEDP